jgi:hypothetical protein
MGGWTKTDSALSGPFRLAFGNQLLDRVERDRELLVVFLFHCFYPPG